MPTLFVENCDKTFAECNKILGDRGTQYDQHAESWRDFPFYALRMAFRALGLPELDQPALRLLGSAALVDLKISRIVGNYKQDTFVDLINYAANLDAEMQRVMDYNKSLEVAGKLGSAHDWRLASDPSCEALVGVTYAVKSEFSVSGITYGKAVHIGNGKWCGKYSNGKTVVCPDYYDANSGFAVADKQ